MPVPDHPAFPAPGAAAGGGTPTPVPGAARVTCIGGAVLDHKLHLLGPARPGTSNPARGVAGAGGVARNVAENLARLGVTVRLVSRVGDDPGGRGLRDGLAGAGVDVGGLETVPGATTAGYVAVLAPDGGLVIGAAAMAVLEGITPAGAEAAWPGSGWVFADCNLPAEVLARLVRRAVADPVVPLAVDAVSAPKVRRLPGDLTGVAVLFCNRDEAAALLDEPVAGPPDGGVPALCDAEGGSPGADGPAEPGAEERLAVRLLDRGARHVVLTRGERGVLLADARGVRPVPAAPARPRDVTGAGDALVAGVLAGLLAGHDLDGAAAVGTLVAARTVESEHSVRPDLPAALIDPTAERYDRQEGAP